MCVDYEAASDVLQAQSDSGISGTLFQRIKSQMCLQPYHAYTNLKQGGKSDVAWRRKIGVCNKQKRGRVGLPRRFGPNTKPY
jgi:hypothetical protein